ncbi:MAG: tyrosine--tRNA ligase [Geodermatophilaceae bacterium]|nr:tyrosine--tRNA ligase [Geodermatophilaceae bacterium]MDQ3463646.1 tyrosine--tRNA ligase [Actinomycetota bacterium]
MSEHHSGNILDELHWRGLVAQSTDEVALRAALDGGPVTLYSGFDPTGPSLHVGHLVPLLTLRRFQLAGHRPIALAGGATGMIGDPRDLGGERQLNSVEVIRDWLVPIRHQLAQFLDFDGDYAARLVDNNEWTASLSTVDFLRDIGKHFSVNVMLARDTIRRRLDSDGISYTEFSYLLLQSMDYLELYRRAGCALQIGGSDQWGNILGGVDLIRRVEGGTTHALTLPLVTSASGEKFGKSTGGGSMWLDPQLTSPYAWYQYWVNTDDADVVGRLRRFTFLGRQEIEVLAEAAASRPADREAQRTLAAEMTTLVHGPVATEQVRAASAALFGQGELPALPEPLLEAALLEAGTVRLSGELPGVIAMLHLSGLCATTSAARRAVAEGGAYVNNMRVTDVDWKPGPGDLLHGRWLVVRRGKRAVAGVEVGGGAARSTT